MRLYLFGPMTKYRESGWNRARFTEVREELTRQGHEVCSPIVMDDGMGGPDAVFRHFKPAQILALDLQVIESCEAIVAVEEWWGESSGSRLEVYGALTFGKKVLAYPGLEAVPVERLMVFLGKVFGEPEAEEPIPAPQPEVPDVNAEALRLLERIFEPREPHSCGPTCGHKAGTGNGADR